MNDSALRLQLINALQNRQAHQVFDDIVAGFPALHFNTRPEGLPYSLWHLLEHMRIAQADILDYIENPNYQYLNFPQDYWPPPEAEADEPAWQATLEAFRDDLSALVSIVRDPSRDLFAQIPQGQPGHNILREVIIVAQHNSYHIGEFGILRATLGLWQASA